MQFTTIFSAALALATLTSAVNNTVYFRNQDNTTRTIVFTSEADLGLAPMDNLVIPGHQNATQEFPEGFIGNWFSVSEGAEMVPGMLGEVRFQGYMGMTFYDISSIVNDQDTDGVKMLYPAGMDPYNATTPTSGCNSVVGKCLTQYNAPDDIATMATDGTHLVCLLGNNNTETITADTRRRKQKARRSYELFPRSFVTSEVVLKDLE